MDWIVGLFYRFGAASQGVVLVISIWTATAYVEVNTHHPHDNIRKAQVEVAPQRHEPMGAV